MRGWTGPCARASGAALCALLAVVAPARADDAVRTADGTTLTVWEEQGPDPAASPGDAVSILAYAVSDTSGVRFGTVPPTADSAADTSPDLVIDAATGAPVLIWSRFDGVFQKLAYARFEQGTWVDFHYLTFGGGDDTSPRAGTSGQGDYLFWRGRGRRLYYAPVELSGGRLLAAPRPLRVQPLATSGPTVVQGGNDVPVTVHKNHGTALGTPAATIQGGNDVPVVINKNGGGSGHASVWVGSGGTCGTLILGLQNARGTVLRIVSFDNGAAREIARVVVPDLAPPDFDKATVAAYAGAACH